MDIGTEMKAGKKETSTGINRNKKIRITEMSKHPAMTIVKEQGEWVG